MESKTIDVTVGIYDSSAELVLHHDNSVTVKIPWVKWSRNGEGSLAFRYVHLTGFDAGYARRVFTTDTHLIGELMAMY